MENNQTISPRRVLKDRRKSWTQKIRIGNQTVFMTCSEYPDKSLGEIFIDVNKCGTALRGVLNAVALFMSIGLQHGVPLNIYLDAIREIDFQPNGLVEGVEELDIKEAKSILDCIAQILERIYLPKPIPQKSIGFISPSVWG